MTNHLPVEVMPAPSQVKLFLKQHVGAPCQVSVKKKPVTSPAEELLFMKRHSGALLGLMVEKKDIVTEGDIIGTVDKGLSANLHASITGTVEAVALALHPMVGNAPAIVISADPEAKPGSYSPVDWKRFSREELLARIKHAGIVGLGGAGFPTHARLTLRPDVRVDTLILNGTEREPYQTCDHRIMFERPHDIIEGAKIILTILGIDYCAIGIEENKADAIEVLSKAIVDDTSKDDFKIVVKPLKVKYPPEYTLGSSDQTTQAITRPDGSDTICSLSLKSSDQIIQAVTGRVRPSGMRSSEIGIIVQNVYTTKAIYDAVAFGKPFYERVVTIAGNGIKRSANLLVKVGTSLADIVDYLGGTTPDLAEVMVGGSMMGFAVSSHDVPITKTTSCVLFLTKDEVNAQSYGSCVRCGFGMGASAVDDCFECDSCTYVCPAKRPLVQFMRLARMKSRGSRLRLEIRN